MSNVKLSLTQRQYMLLMEVVDALPRALSNFDEDGISPDSMPDTSGTLSVPPTPPNDLSPSESGVNLEPEVSVVQSPNGTRLDMWTALDFVFSVNSIALELYSVDAHHGHDLQKHSIARFALDQTHLGVKRLSDGATEAEFSLKTISFSNTRSGNSVFRDIVPASGHEGNQM